MTIAPCAARRALTVLLPDPIPPVRPSRNTEARPSRTDVDVVHVVGGGAAPVAHASPAVRRGGPPDPLLPDQVVDAELGRILLQERGDLVARRRVDHDVDRGPSGVVASAAAEAAVAADRRELGAHRAED